METLRILINWINELLNAACVLSAPPLVCVFVEKRNFYELTYKIRD